jgi:gliding motility-associated-like protein
LSDNCESTPLILTTTVSVEFPIQTITQIQPTCNYTADGEIHVDNNLAIEYSIDNGITWQADTFFMNLPNGSYTVCSRSALGCITCENVSLNTPAVLLNVSADTTICQNDAALISANAIGGGSFLFNWDFTPNTDAVQTVLPFNSTTYTVVAENELGCFSTPESISVNVLELPIPSYTILTQPLCAPVEVEIENSTSNVAVQSVDWVIGNSQTFIDQNQITTASLMAGTYDIEMNVTSDQGCTNSLIFPNAIVVATPPTADFNYAPNPILMYDTEVQFSNTSVNGELYQWSFQSANPFYSVDQNPTTTFPEGETGEYVTTLITISQEGCQDTMQKTLEVVPELMIFAPNTFTPDGDEYNPRWKVHLTGIDIYSFSLLIYNRWGQVIWESNNVEVGWDGTFNNQLLPQGTYIWKVVTKDINTDKAYSFSGQVNLLR